MQKGIEVEQSPILMQMLLAKTRPVLKKSSLLHQGNCNALMIFKSVEIIVIEEDTKNQKKIHNPMYIPVTGLNELLSLSKKQLEMKII